MLTWRNGKLYRDDKRVPLACVADAGEGEWLATSRHGFKRLWGSLEAAQAWVERSAT
jgi:hypothetical protein